MAPRGGQEPLPLKVAPIQPSVTAAFHLQSRRDSDCQMWELVLIVINLHDTVKVLENSVEILQDENADLRTRLEALDARPAVAASAPEQQGSQNTSAQPNNAQAARPPPVLPTADDLVPSARAPSVSSRYSFESSDSSTDSSSSESEDYIPVSRRKTSRVKKSRANHTRPASRTTQVTSGATPLQGATSRPVHIRAAASGRGQRTEVYVGGVNGANTSAHIQAHLAKHGVKINLDDIHLLSNHGHWKSFRISVPVETAEKVTTAGRRMWPVGVQCRLFTERPRGARSLGASKNRAKAIKAAPTHQTLRPAQGRRQAPTPSKYRKARWQGPSRAADHPHTETEDWPSLSRYRDYERHQPFNYTHRPYRSPEYEDWSDEQPWGAGSRDRSSVRWNHQPRSYVPNGRYTYHGY